MAIPLRLLLLLLAIACITAAFLPPTYDTNDDVVMSMLLAGKALVDTPTGDAVWINVLLGKCLAACYSAVPAIPWYGLTLLLIVATAQLLIVDAIFQGIPSRAALLLSLGSIVTIGAYAIANLQFTVVAALACASGWFWLHVVNRTNGSRLGLSILAAGCIVSGALLRFDSFLLVAAIYTPPFFVCCLIFKRSDDLSTPDWRRRSLLLGAIGFALAAHAYHMHHYAARPEWRDFFDLKKVQREFLDDGHAPWTEHTRQIFEANGWNELDYQLFNSWCFAEKLVFSIESMNRILSEIPSTVKYRSFSTSVSRLSGIPKTRLIFILAAPVLLGLWVATRGWQSALASIVTVAAVLTLALYLLMFRKLPDRVVASMAIAASMALLASLAVHAKSTKARRLDGCGWRWCTGWTMVAVSLLPVERQIYLSHSRQNDRRHMPEDLENFAKVDARVIVAWGDAFSYQALSPLDSLHSFDKRCWISLGWPFDSPATTARLEMLGIDDLLASMHRRQDVVVVCSPEQVALYRDFVARKFGYDVAAKPVFQGGSFSAFRFQKPE